MMAEDDEKDFFIGWEGEPAAEPTRHSRRASLLLVGIGLAAAALAAGLQTNFASKGTWDLQQTEFEGVLIAEPYPTLVAEDAVYYLAMETKHALPKKQAEPFHLQRVRIQGSLIEDPDQDVAMITLRSASNIYSAADAGANPLDSAGPGERVTLRGEIADSKCALGAMNPGVFKPHRACAIACISGGLPPVLIVRHDGGGATHYLLTDENGRALNEAVLPYVAIPVEVSGVVHQLGNWRILRAPIEGIEVLR